ncbi:MAG: hypothetical protein IKO05_08730 [Selenomonadaceae bacterium]|nr:hypothetical protein [Selenomonadaceae bacterium]
MIKLYDENFSGYVEAEVKDFYCNDLPVYFAKIDKNSYVRNFSAPVYSIPKIFFGSMPRDGGNLIIEADEYEDFIRREPAAKKWIRPYVGSREFIRKLPRYCLWLVDCPPNELRKMKLVYERVQAVKNFRLASKAPSTRNFAKTPWLFCQIAQPKTDYLLVPGVSSERRDYIPIGFMDANTIVSNLAFSIPNAKWWHFGVLTSSVHMTWMRMTCGRLENRYRYSGTIVYNGFPWPPFWRKVERTAGEILLARRKFPEASFADLYDPLTMPKELRRAHEANDRAVMEAYDFSPRMTEHELQVTLLRLYETLSELKKLFDDMDAEE